ncbi:MAG: YkgJ family cysteine cluster protein [Anaerolineales bacterium]|nr:YkgJ family cysteine cluster protein [Anaerolineales bacterium]
MSAESICLQCGACCAYFRVAFYWGEADPNVEGAVPMELTQKLDPLRMVMKGTHSRPVRCVALDGTVGQGVCCTIYESRPSPCRELQVAWVNGVPSEQCDRARLAWGLKPIEMGELLTAVSPLPSLPTNHPIVAQP